MRALVGAFPSDREVTMNEAAVYSSYRSVLRGLRRANNSRDCRASKRKQTARVQKATKFGIPIRDVKDIVRRHDALNGITHEHPKPYLQSLAVKAARERMYSEDLHDGSTCIWCDITLAEAKEALLRLNPDVNLDQITVFRVTFEDEAYWDPDSDNEAISDPYRSMVWECFFCDHMIDPETGRTIGRSSY